jgi:hypothetical protein
MRVLAMPARDDMSSLLRVQWPAEELQRQGYDVEISTAPWMMQERDRHVHKVEPMDCDVIVLCRPKHRYIAESIPLFQAAGIAVVVDYDDDLGAVHRHNVARAAFDPGENAESNWRWALECASRADMVTVTTPALLEVYASHGRGVVLPNRIPAWRVPEPARGPGKPRLGWAGFIGTHPTDLTMLDGAATRVLRGRMQPFHVVGPASPLISRQLGGCGVRASGLVDKERWMVAVRDTLDVGIAPAEPSAFNRSKSCLKSVEGAACGVAMIASPTPDNRRAAADGLCVLATGRREWENWMRLFLDDAGARAEQVERARAGLGAHLLEPHVGETWAAWVAAHQIREASYSGSVKVSN